jgi:hypothetical protein
VETWWFLQGRCGSLAGAVGIDVEGATGRDAGVDEMFENDKFLLLCYTIDM